MRNADLADRSYKLGASLIGAAVAMVATILPASAQSDLIGSGSGFLINSDGWLVTNAHVVEECSRVTVAGHGEISGWKIDAQNDLAVARLAGLQGEPIPVRRTPARLGEDIATLGYPLSDVLSSSVKVTTGNVNALLGLGDDTRYLQISAPVQPDNSGGPLVDRSGALLGITSAVLKPGTDGFAPQNVNFAVRASMLEQFLQSRGIDYPALDAIGQLMDTADLAEKVARGTFQLLCHSAGAAPLPPVVGNDAPAPSLSEKAVEFAAVYHAVWSLPNATALRYLESKYADPVDFYGKSTSSRAVLDEKRRFANRWPYRSYAIRQGTASAVCNGAVCKVSALVDFVASSLNRTSSGVGSFDLTVDMERRLITRETGSVQKGWDVSPDYLIRVWDDFNSRCRGGSGVDPATGEACTIREQVTSLLTKADLCYGREGEAGYQYQWHWCGPDSLRY